MVSQAGLNIIKTENNVENDRMSKLKFFCIL